MDGIRIDALPVTVLPTVEHEIPAMKDGTTVKLTVAQIIGLLSDSAPETLDTLNELAAALGDDPNFATTVLSSLALKADQSDLDEITENVGFRAYGVTGASSNFGDVNPIPFTGNTDYNTGTPTSVFNGTVFTAPVDGFYCYMNSLYKVDNTTFAASYVRKNAVDDINRAHALYRQTMVMEGRVYLDAGDTLQVRSDAGVANSFQNGGTNGLYHMFTVWLDRRT